MPQTDEIVVRFRSEGGQDVEEAFRRVGAGADRVAPGLKRVGEGFDNIRLKSERGVAYALRGFVQDASQARTASEVLALGLFRLGEAFRGSLLLAGISVAGITIYQRLKGDMHELTKARDELSKEMGKPFGIEARQSADAITAQIEALSKAIDTLKAKESGIGPTISRLFSPDRPTLTKYGLVQPKTDTREADAQKRIVDLGGVRVKQELSVLAAKQKEIEVDELAGKIDLVKLDTQNKLANLILQQAQHKLSPLNALKESLVLKVDQAQQIKDLEHTAKLKKEELNHESDLADLGLTVANTEHRKLDTLMLEVAYSQRLVDLAQGQNERTAALIRLKQQLGAVSEVERNFARDVGSGDFLKQLAQQRLEEQQEARGREIIGELRDARAHGTALGPNAQAILDRADKINAAKGDFSGIASLAGLKFEGLRALDNLSITIK